MNEGEEKGASKEKPLHSGHRQRMLERFETGAEHFQDHEILEVLLFYAIPRNNTNPIAHALINAFGSLGEVFRASVKELSLVSGVGKKTAEYIRCIGQCFDRIKPETKSIPLYFNPKQFCDFLEEDYRGRIKEILEFFCLNKQGRLLFRKEYSVGKSDEVNVDPTKISELLLATKPHTVVVAHNHPKGTRFPSAQDDLFTKQLFILCHMNNVKLGDHIVVGSDGVYSYHAVGKLDQIKKDCASLAFDEGLL